MGDKELIDLYVRAPWYWQLFLPLLALLYAFAQVAGDHFNWAYQLGGGWL